MHKSISRLLFCSLIIPVIATAQDEAWTVHPGLHSKFHASAGIFFPSRSLELRLGGSVAPIDEVIDVDEHFQIIRYRDSEYVL